VQLSAVHSYLRIFPDVVSLGIETHDESVVIFESWYLETSFKRKSRVREAQFNFTPEKELGNNRSRETSNYY
jgi:hypothetical protein